MSIYRLQSIPAMLAMIAITCAGPFPASARQTILPSLTEPADTIIYLNPPVNGFYTKYLNCDGIAIRSASVVNDKALQVASSKIKRILYYMAAAKKNLVKNGAEVHIIGKDQQTSDLPEFADRKGVKYTDHGDTTNIDRRTRGMGGLFASCGEENLLNLPSDKYRGGYDICVHEFAHTLMSYGLDSIIRAKIYTQYQKSIAAGLWKNVYAAENPLEYWAELSTWYFGAHGDFLSGTTTPRPGPAGLREYDPEGYILVASVYSGILEPQLIEKKASMAVSKGNFSIPSTEKAELMVTNNRPAKLKLYWVNFEGKPEFYSAIDAGERFVQSTFISHVWMIEDENGKVLVRMQVNDSPCKVVINPETK